MHPSMPLEGVRIVDLTWAGVGPYCTFLCALMGAEVIKTETISHPTIFRGIRPSGASEKAEDDTRWFSLDELYVNKMGVSLNLKNEKGLEIAKKLIAVSDVVAENFQAGVTSRLGLGYEVLRKINPAIVMCSMSAHGATGPERHGKGLAQVFSALGGAGYLTGYQDGPPVELRLPVDLIAGTMGCFALLSSLWRARETGRGGHIDIASREVVTSFIGESILDAMVNDRNQTRMGNHDTLMAPHNVYPCGGEDAWISLAVGSEREWASLCLAMDKPELVGDPRFLTESMRRKNSIALDTIISGWTGTRDKMEVMELLQKVGVAATASYTAADLLADPHLHARDVFWTTEDIVGNPLVMMGAPWRFSRTPAKLLSRPNKIGEHNEYVYGDLLGFSKGEVEKLKDEGAIN